MQEPSGHATLRQRRTNVASTLTRHCINSMCPLGNLEEQQINRTKHHSKHTTSLQRRCNVTTLLLRFVFAVCRHCNILTIHNTTHTCISALFSIKTWKVQWRQLHYGICASFIIDKCISDASLNNTAIIVGLSKVKK